MELSKLSSPSSQKDKQSTPTPSTPISRSSSQNLTKKGWLKKKKFWSKWKDLYYVIDGDVLLEFKSDTASKPSKSRNLGEYILRTAENVTGAARSFALYKVKGEKETTFLAAGTEADFVEWVAILSKYCTQSEVNWNPNQMLDALNDAAVLSSDRGIILAVNDTACDLFGYTKNEMIGNSLAILMPEKVGARHAEYMSKYITTGQKNLIGKPRKLPIVTKQGQTIMVTLSLGEFSGEQKTFVATMRLEDPSQLATEMEYRAVMHEVIDKRLQQTCEDLKEDFSKQLTSIYNAISDLKSKNAELSLTANKASKIKKSHSKKHLHSFAIDLSQIEINEKIYDAGGSGASVYLCDVDGWSCVMKEVILQGEGFSTEGFEQEITLLESLPHHKNLVRYLFHVKTSASIRLFMTRYSGSLTSVIKQRRGTNNHFSISDVVRFAFDLVRGLEVLHDHGVIHRDLKSDNIFVTMGATNEIKHLSIADFDTAKFIHSGNEAKTTLGTPGYMAPEVIKARGKQQYTFAADMWSLGMVLYEIMALKRPFEDVSNLFELSMIAESGKAPPLSEGLALKYKKILPFYERCLSIEPELRPTVKMARESLAKLL